MIKSAAKIGFTFVIVFLMVKLSSHFLTADAVDLCDSISSDATIDSVTAISETKGYRQFKKDIENSTTITIPTQNSPFFRFACVITFEDGRLMSKEVRADD